MTSLYILILLPGVSATIERDLNGSPVHILKFCSLLNYSQWSLVVAEVKEFYTDVLLVFT